FKLRGDWSFCEGVNLTVLTEYLHQPYTDRVPGVNAWFGTAFNRNNTWFFDMDSWVLYEKRCNFMLQQGLYVADLAYFIGEDAPKMAGITDPAPPNGYSYDLINGDVIRQRLSIRDGRFSLPDGMSYKLLVLPPLDNMRPELLEKIRDLVQAGGNIYGPPPTHSPSLQNYPDADEMVKKLVQELWQDCNGENITSASLGKGKVFWGLPLDKALKELGTAPDVKLEDHPEILWIHRATQREDIYFLSNQSEETVRIDPVFRITDRQPECWNAVTGSMQKTAMFEKTGKGMHVPLELGPRASIFVVFRDATGLRDPLRIIRRGDQEIRTDVVLTDQGIELILRENGNYSLIRSSGRESMLEVKDIPESIGVSGPWEVSFTAGWGAPGSTQFDELINWTESNDPGIKYYSGTATYKKQVELPESLFSEDFQLILDLGKVGNIANVKVNG
ncbi:MAG: glycoside hydrolase family 2, partial [Bacteroidales bacterium]|nr:glycoside hydrolase family 2 [Bacteroidales bacterium]